MGKNQHVLHDPNGGWYIKGEGNQKATLHTQNKQEAINKAREISQNQRSELFIHGMDGKIQSRDLHGHDPNPPKG
ncbi:DUF2188 domain-containing protein [Bombilactobacillus bombi]|uniref:DUF2188 domain-containing protein n=1 Tax=Bombilactobacillus bombi TaxID=1303590 RepID=A0A417Z3L2_9LACO|nr:DUF2188 domain-containing protein [Bombilactobacillus bombi]RHW45288.1 DUF2188 domain-containing protein [Bombilactobacillus bombi]